MFIVGTWTCKHHIRNGPQGGCTRGCWFEPPKRCRKTAAQLTEGQR